MQNFNQAISNAVLLHRSEDSNQIQTFSYKYYFPETDEIRFYTVTVQPSTSFKMDEQTKLRVQPGTHVYSCSSSEYIAFIRKESSDYLEVIGFSLVETAVQPSLAQYLN